MAEKKTTKAKAPAKKPAHKVNPIIEGLPSSAVWPDPKPAAAADYSKPKTSRRKK